MCELHPGSYCIGDPSLLLKTEYIPSEDMWESPGIYHHSLFSYAYGYTGFVEGSYQDTQFTYPIVHGVLGMIPSNLCDPERMEKNGYRVYYPDPIHFYTNGVGYFEILSTNYTYILDTRVNTEQLQKEDEDYDY